PAPSCRPRPSRACCCDLRRLQPGSARASRQEFAAEAAPTKKARAVVGAASAASLSRQRRRRQYVGAMEVARALPTAVATSGAPTVPLRRNGSRVKSLRRKQYPRPVLIARGIAMRVLVPALLCLGLLGCSPEPAPPPTEPETAAPAAAPGQ